MLKRKATDFSLVLGYILHSHIILSSACEIADTWYYHANLFNYLLEQPNVSVILTKYIKYLYLT